MHKMISTIIALEFGLFLSLSGLFKAGIPNLTGYYLSLLGQVTSSGIICYGNTSTSGSLNSYNIMCKNTLTIWFNIL